VRKKLGETLIQAGLISEDDLGTALEEHKRSGERLGVVLVRLNFATERQIAKALAYQLGFTYVNLSENAPDPAVVALISKDVALKRSCIALQLEKNLLTVAMADPLLFSLVQDLEFQTGYRIKQVVATRADILEAISAGYPDKALMRTAPGVSGMPARRPVSPDTNGEMVPGGDTALVRRVEDDVFEPGAGLKEHGDAAPIVDLVDLVIKSAIKSAASDIHIEPLEKGVLVRHRLDGLLKEVMDLPKWVHEGLIARMKIMAGHGHRRETASTRRPYPRDG
jgi:type IV pilus assembly protein PilB